MLLPDINIPAQCAAGLYPVTIQPTGRPCLPAGPIVHPKKLVMYSPATDDDGVGNMHSSSLFAFCFVLFGIFSSSNRAMLRASCLRRLLT
jgi:hypothetical protein